MEAAGFSKRWFLPTSEQGALSQIIITRRELSALLSNPANAVSFLCHAFSKLTSHVQVIRMLFVVVAEFFICWAPLHVLNTWYTFSPEAVYNTVGSTGVSLVQLLAYISSCCNPITYCFMNRKFRQAFLGVFDCYKCRR
jgi:hypothetical protein